MESNLTIPAKRELGSSSFQNSPSSPLPHTRARSSLCLAMGMNRENRLFLGNPGAGKSTLINCLIGENHMQSGVSWGGGLTKDYQRFIKDGIAYMDTPGLADETIQREAADAITKALKQSGTYKLFFLVRLQNGRVVSDDLVTLERVLDSIDAGDLNYKFTIVMNCVGQRQYESLVKRGEEFKKIKTLINRRYLTESFCFIPCIKALEERTDVVVELPHEVRTFMDVEAPVIRVEEVQVKPIAVVGFAQQSQEIKTELEKLRNDHAALLRAMKEQEKRHEEAMQQIRASRAADMGQTRWGAPVATSPRGDHNYSRFPSTPTDEGFLSRFSRRTNLAALIIIVVVVIAIIIGVVMVTESSSASSSSSPPKLILGPSPVTSAPSGTSSATDLEAPSPSLSNPTTPPVPKISTPPVPDTPTPRVIRIHLTPAPEPARARFYGCFHLGFDLMALKAVSQFGTTKEDGVRLAVENDREYFVIMTLGVIMAFDANLSSELNPPTCQDLGRSLLYGYWNVYKVTRS